MFQKLYNPSFCFIPIICLMMVSCNKSDRDEDTETLSARDYAIAHHIFDDAFRQVHRFAMADTLLNDTNVQQTLDNCLDKGTTGLSDTVAIFPLFLQLNYGDKGTACYDGGKRYGVIKAKFSGKYLNNGTTVTITFKDYKKDVYDVDGTVTIINGGLNSQGRRKYVMTLESGIITSTNINIDVEGTFSFTWADGSSTETDFTDDVFEITEGFVSGRNSRGSAFTNEITAAYSSDLNCAHFVSGRSAMEVQNLIPRTLNYGTDGTCDNILISRRNNTYIEVEIPIMPLATF